MPTSPVDLPKNAVVTVAGGSPQPSPGFGYTGDFSGDNGPAANAALNTPRGVAATRDGGFLIADAGNHVIRKVSASGTITTVAGTPRANQNGVVDGQQATKAELNFPCGISVTADGGFLVTSTMSSRVYRVSPDGTITKVAGSTQGLDYTDTKAVTADLSRPQSVAATSDGGFLIADSLNYRVCRVSPDGSFSPVVHSANEWVAGDPSAGPAAKSRLQCPSGVVSLPDRGYLVADTYQLLRVSAAGVLSIEAGTPYNLKTGNDLVGVPGPAGAARIYPQAVAVTADGAYLIAESDINRISRVSKGQIEVVAGQADQWHAHGVESPNRAGDGDGRPATEARLGGPSGIAVLDNGDIVFTEAHTHRVRKILAQPLKRVSSMFPIVPGSNGFQFSVNQDLVSPSGNYNMRYQADGNLCLYGSTGNFIWGLNLLPGWASVTGGSATFTPDGNLLTKKPNGDTAWSTNTFGNPGAQLNVTDDGRVTIVSTQGKQLWSSKS